MGKFKLMDKFNIVYDLDPSTIVYTLIAIAYDGKFAGWHTLPLPTASKKMHRLQLTN